MRERHRPPSLDDLCATLRERRDRLATLEERGTEPLSRYGIDIAHGGNVEQALATAKWLVDNQIAYYTRQLKADECMPQQTNFFPQLHQNVEVTITAEPTDDPVITTP